MNKTRLWTLGSIIAMLVIVVGGWFLGIQPQLDANAVAASDLELVENKNFTLEADLGNLKKEFEELDTNQARVDELRLAIPGNDKLDTFIGQLNSMAEGAGVTVSNFTSSEAAPFVPSTAAAAAIPPGIDATTFLTIPITITVDGERDAIMAFVGALQSGPRLMLVSDFTLSTSEDASNGLVSGLLFVYVDEPLVVVDPEAPADSE